MVQSRSMTRGNSHAQLSRLRESVTSTNPMVAATLRNATPKNGRSPEANELTAGHERNAIMPHKLEKVSNIIANNINAANDLRAITPYIDRAELIWSSLLLYPNGKQKQILDYSTRSSRYKSTPLHTALTKVWKDYFTNDYKIEEELREMVDDILWNTGSYATLTMSRVSLDYLINGMEVVNRGGKESFNPTEVYKNTAGNFTYDTNASRLKVINVGNYVRPIDDTSNHVFNVAGMEALGGTFATSNHTEFDILRGSRLDGSEGFFISLTDNPAVLAEHLLGEKRKEFNEKFYSGNESFGSLIQQTIGNQSLDKPVLSEIGSDKDKKGGKKPEKPKATTVNMSNTDINAIQNQVFPHRRAAHQFIQFIKQDIDFGVENYGTPIDWHVPSAAIIPIHINGNVRKKKDYIILMDPYTGEFLNPTTDFQFYQSAKRQADGITNKNSQGSTNSLIDNLKQIQQGKDCDFDMTEFAELSKSIVIEQFMKSVLSGRSGSISIDLDEETNKIFLARMFRGQGIRALYVPGECVTYSAVKYGTLGTGQALTNQAKMHIARLAAMDLADAMANMEAAQSTNRMRITIDKDDPNPERTIAMAREVFFRANPRFYNVLATSQMSIPVLVDAFKELSLTLEVDASENPYMPTPQVEVSPMEKQNFRKVDPESRNEVLNKIANYFMLPKGWLDVADDNNNFQIEALQEHRLVYNQAINWQEQIADFVKERQLKYVRAHKPFMISLIQVIASNKNLWKSDSKEEIPGSTDAEKIEFILEDFLNGIECSLPVPSVMEAANKIKEGLSTAKELVDQWWEANGKEGLIDKAATSLNISGEYTKDDLMAMVKAHLYQKAHKMLNIPSPFDEAIDDPTGGGIASIIENVVLQNKSLYEFLSGLSQRDLEERTKFIKKHKTKIEKALAAYQTVGGEEEEEEVDPNAPPAEGGTTDEFNFNTEEVKPTEEGGEEVTEETDETETEEEVKEDDKQSEDDKPADQTDDTSGGEASSTELSPDAKGPEKPFA